MRPEQRNDSNYEVARRKWLWWQYVGMGIFLSWPVAIQVAGYLRLNIRLDVLSVLMVFIAVIVFAIGHVGRQQLKEGKR